MVKRHVDIYLGLIKMVKLLIAGIRQNDLIEKKNQLSVISFIPKFPFIIKRL